MELARARVLAQELMVLHKLDAWTFDFDNARGRCGLCDVGNKRIQLSKFHVLLNDESEVRDTILHEIAHALVEKPGERHHNHDDAWRAMAISIGCTGLRCAAKDTAIAPYKYLGLCKTCGRKILKNRRGNKSCGACCSKYNPKFKFKWIPLKASSNNEWIYASGKFKFTYIPAKKSS
jgi:predicted SprT family Zn-dependent metalloprotease